MKAEITAIGPTNKEISICEKAILKSYIMCTVYLTKLSVYEIKKTLHVEKIA